MSVAAHYADVVLMLNCALSAAAPEREVGGKDWSGHGKEIQVSAGISMSVLRQAREQFSGANMHCAASHLRLLLALRYLGLYVTEIEAAIAYDTEAIAQKGILAVTNFALSGYQHLMSAP